MFKCPRNLKRVDVLRNKLNYTHTNVGAKAQPHQPLPSIVFPTQMLNYVRFVYDCGVCVNSISWQFR